MTTRHHRFPYMALIWLCLSASAAGAERLTIPAAVVAQPPHVDGDISDACWRQAPEVSEFYFATDGSRGCEATKAWLCYDQKAIYVAFDCRDSQPDKVRGEQMKRGGDLGSDDWVGFDLDGYGDGRAVVWFDVSSAGTQVESVQSGGASNIRWRGDWDGAARRTPDGYTAEMAIPFSILQYDDKRTSMGILLLRRHARMGQIWMSPNAGTDWDWRRFYLWDGLKLPRYRNAPLVLGYALLGSGVGDSTRTAGLDVKHTITPSLTGLLTVNPDFRNVEQDVESIDFTYGERWQADRRPFFQEGEQYFPDSWAFYTRRIQDIDLGAKLVGNVGPYGIGAMHASSFGHSSYSAASVGRKWRAADGLKLAVIQSDTPDGSGLTLYGLGGYRIYDRGDRNASLNGALFSAGGGQLYAITCWSSWNPRKLNFGVERRVIGSHYDPLLGLVNDKGTGYWGLTLNTYDEFSKGSLAGWSVDANLGRRDLLTGGLYDRGLNLSGNLYWRKGYGVYLSGWTGRRADLAIEGRPIYQDNGIGLGAWWGDQSLYRRGGLELTVGHTAGGAHLDCTLRQGWAMSRRLSVEGRYEHSHIRAPSVYGYFGNQFVGSLSYDLDNERTLTGRLVVQRRKTGVAGDNPGWRRNVFLAYRQKVRAGMDAYLLFGDPNSLDTSSSVTLKLIRPFGM